jgi:hypothetical protein
VPSTHHEGNQQYHDSLGKWLSRPCDYHGYWLVLALKSSECKIRFPVRQVTPFVLSRLQALGNAKVFVIAGIPMHVTMLHPRLLFTLLRSSRRVTARMQTYLGFLTMPRIIHYTFCRVQGKVCSSQHHMWAYAQQQSKPHVSQLAGVRGLRRFDTL